MNKNLNKNFEIFGEMEILNFLTKIKLIKC